MKEASRKWNSSHRAPASRPHQLPEGWRSQYLGSGNPILNSFKNRESRNYPYFLVCFYIITTWKCLKYKLCVIQASRETVQLILHRPNGEASSKFQYEMGEKKPAMMDENKLRCSGFWEFKYSTNKTEKRVNRKKDN